MVLKIAIVGNIASGKSQAELFFKDLGYPVYDTDDFSHQILNEMTDFYGYDIFTQGKPDRKKLGKLIFSNPQLKQKLEEFIHPKVKNKIVEVFEKHKNEKLIFVSVPLLYEAGFEGLFDKVIFISANENIRLKRLMKRNNLTEEEAILRIKAQVSEDIKIKKADYTIFNNESMDYYNKQLSAILNKLKT